RASHGGYPTLTHPLPALKKAADRASPARRAAWLGLVGLLLGLLLGGPGVGGSVLLVGLPGRPDLGCLALHAGEQLGPVSALGHLRGVAIISVSHGGKDLVVGKAGPRVQARKPCFGAA